MSVHIGAKVGDIAETVLLPGDPLRAKFIAETYLEDVVCYNQVRGMYGYTGTYKGKRISVQGSGMGMPSIGIYAHELINEYKCKNLIRIGSCGSVQPEVKVKDVILSMASSTNSNMNKQIFKGMDFAACADFGLLKKAYDKAQEKGVEVRVGNTLSSDTFYDDDSEVWKLWARFGVLGIEMEATALYTLAAKFGVNALTILTVSDNIPTGEAMTADERQFTLKQMIEIALELA